MVVASNHAWLGWLAFEVGVEVKVKVKVEVEVEVEIEIEVVVVVVVVVNMIETEVTGQGPKSRAPSLTVVGRYLCSLMCLRACPLAKHS